jgi:hypothetical protein
MAWQRHHAAAHLDRAAAQRLAGHGDDRAAAGDASALEPGLAWDDAASRDDARSRDDHAASGWRWMARPDRGRPGGTSSGRRRMAWRWRGPAAGWRCAAAGGW